MTPDVPAVNPGAVLSVSDILWSEADLLDGMAAMIVQHGMTVAEAVRYLRTSADMIRRASRDAIAGRDLNS